MSAATPLAIRSAAVSTRRFSELDASREISRIAASSHDVTAVIESIATLALNVSGVKRIQIQYVDPVDGTASEPFEWSSARDSGIAAAGSAVANVSAGGQCWGELRLYFELQPSTLESPLRFAKFLAQQVGLQLSRWSLNLRADELRQRTEQLRKIIEKRKAIQRARAIIVNTHRVDGTGAIQLMRQYSKDSGRTLHEVAEAIIFGDAGKWTSPRYVPRKRSLRLLNRPEVSAAG